MTEPIFPGGGPCRSSASSGALITEIGPDGRAQVRTSGLVPGDEARLFARSLVAVGRLRVGREVAVVVMDGAEPLILGLIQPLVPRKWRRTATGWCWRPAAK